jgi:glyoxylase-like metal-dependent hydrolase (beta-lactamase superfamily II)
MIRNRLLRRGIFAGVFTVLGSFAGAGMANNDGHHGGGGGNEQKRPPQTLQQGFETTDELLRDARRAEQAHEYSVWIVESSRFVGVPARSFMPDGVPPNFPDTVDLPVNIGIIKDRHGNITLYDSGWSQRDYQILTGSCCNKDLPLQMAAIGLDPKRVVRIVIGHGHWDHAGQLLAFPNAVLYVQKEELKQIDFFLDYPVAFNGGHIRAVNVPSPPSCARTPVCGYPPKTVNEILGKLKDKKAKIVNGRHEIERGMIIHPAFRGHTYGSQLLQVNTAAGQLVFGSDTYSSWFGIRDWLVANIQQTDTIQQFLAYEKCYVLTSKSPDLKTGYNNCIAAHEPASYTDAYPITKNWWNIPNGNCSRAAELTLSNGQTTLVPASPDKVKCVAPIQ